MRKAINRVLDKFSNKSKKWIRRAFISLGTAVSAKLITDLADKIFGSQDELKKS